MVVHHPPSLHHSIEHYIPHLMYVPHNAFFDSHTYKQIVLADYLLIFTMLLILFKYVAGSELDPPKVVHFLDESTQVQQHFLRV